MVTSVPSGSGRANRRGPWFTLLAGLLFLLVAGAASAGVLTHLKSGGFDDPGSGSVAAAEALERSFPDSQPNLVVLVRDAEGGIDSASARAEAQAVEKTVSGTSGTRVVASYFATRDASLRSGDSGLILVRIDGDENESMRTTEDLHEELSDPMRRRLGLLRRHHGHQRRHEQAGREGHPRGRDDRDPDHPAAARAGLPRSRRRCAADAPGGAHHHAAAWPRSTSQPSSPTCRSSRSTSSPRSDSDCRWTTAC